MSVKQCLLVSISLVLGAGSSVCPESKKLYPGDCRLFYKCVPLSEAAQAYVWVPSRCTAGMVYDLRLEGCVFPKEDWDCEREQSEDFHENSLYSLKGGASAEGATGMTDYPATSTVRSGIYMSEFNDDDKSLEINRVSSERNKDVEGMVETDSLPLSAVNNPSLDPIGTQMHRLTQLISSLKATVHNNIPDFAPTRRPLVPLGYSALRKPTLDLSFPFKFPIHELNLLQAQIYKITAQLISQPPHIHQSNPLQSQTKTPTTNYNPVVSDLYNKYLTNTTFLERGEFTKSCNLGDRLPNPTDCTKYHICKSSITFSCPPNTAFNKDNKNCDALHYEKCKRSFCIEENRNPDPFSKNYYLICARSGETWKEFRARCPKDTEFCNATKTCMSRIETKFYCY